MITGINPRIEKEMEIEPKDYIKYAKSIATILNNHIGKSNAISANEIAEDILTVIDDADITPLRVRTIIKYMRHRGYVPCIMSLGKGYWIAESPEESLQTLQYLDDKRRAEEYTMLCLKEQLEERFGCKINICNPDETNEENNFMTVSLS